MSECQFTGEKNCKCSGEIEPVYKFTYRTLLRKLFTDHANYTHLFIFSYLSNAPTTEFFEERLLTNQEDIGSVFGRYDSETGDRLTELLKEHILLAKEIVIALDSDLEG